MQLNVGVALTAGQTYWAVFRGVNKGANWLFHRQEARQVLFSTTSGATWAQNGIQKTFSLRVEDTPVCGPNINPNPVPGTLVGDMYASPGGESFQTIFINNNGNADLTLTGGTFSGPGAAYFRLMRGEPNGPANQPYAFPRTIGASAQGGEILYVVCTGALPDGLRSATFTLTSNDADTPSISWPVECLTDATPPSVAFTQTPNGQQGWFTVSPATLTAQGIDPESGNRVKAISCTDSNGPNLIFNAGSIVNFAVAGNGIHNISCRATDVANNVTPAPGNAVTVKVDAAAPISVAGAGPSGATSSASATFAFTASDAHSGLAGGECRLDAGVFAACTSPASVSGLADGNHTYFTRARDNAGNLGAAVSWSWRVDTTAPDTTVGGGPAALTTLQAGSFTLTGADPGGFGGVTLQCSLDGAAFAPCASPAAFAGLGEGQHVFVARAVDAVGNVDATPASFTWTIDRTAPTARVVTGPAVRTIATTATFTFAADTPGAAAHDRYECRIDGAPFVVCASPITFNGLAFGQEHTLDVRSIDTIGNAQSPATRYAWRISNEPFAADDRASTVAGTAVDIPVLANDVEPLGGALTISRFSATSDRGGTVTQTAGGLTYTPLAGFVGTDTFVYRVTGSTGLESEPATVTVEVAAAPPPIAVPDPPVVTPPVVTGTGTPTPIAPAADRTAPKITKLSVVARKLSFKLSEAAKVTIKVERRIKLRWFVVARAGSKRAVKVGTTNVTLPKGMVVGRYRVTVSAVDAAGNKARNAQAGFQIKPKPKPKPKS